uniref:Uncharacterized protein n=1 Tax=Salix viminalis TaxID=40686 RepID=A0A6N2K5Q5_SALVM
MNEKHNQDQSSNICFVNCDSCLQSNQIKTASNFYRQQLLPRGGKRGTHYTDVRLEGKQTESARKVARICLHLWTEALCMEEIPSITSCKKMTGSVYDEPLPGMNYRTRKFFLPFESILGLYMCIPQHSKGLVTRESPADFHVILSMKSIFAGHDAIKIPCDRDEESCQFLFDKNR